MLDARDVTVRLGQHTALDRVTVTARPGALTAICGPNGSGKTTLLRAMSGDLPYRGSITLNTHEVAKTDGVRLAGLRAVLSQFTPLAFPFTVTEVVQLGRMGSLATAAPDRTTQALGRVGLAGYGGRHYQELSGGEQQRVHLARVLTQVWDPVIRDVPRWLFLDEPVSSLDIAHQLQVMQIARDFADAGGGVIAVMHDLNLTAMFADEIALLAKGRLVRQGTPETVLRDDLLSEAYGCALRVGVPPESGPYLLPHAAQLAAQ